MYVRLEDERGEPIREHDGVADTQNIFHLHLGSGDATLPYVGYIDWCSDSTFSGFQMEPFIADWMRIMGVASEEHRDVLQQVLDLAQTCRDSVHIYLKFYGN